MKKRLALHCANEEYQRLFGAYLRKYWQDSFVVVEPDKEADILIMDRQVESLESSNAKIIFYFSEERSEEDNELYRYQSAKGLVQEILFKCKESVLPESKGRKGRLVIFYTPGGNSAQSLAAKEYAKRLGSMEKTLYIYYGAFGETEPIDGGIDLSVLCYKIFSEGSEFLTKEKVIAAVAKEETYEYLRYFHNPIHVSDMKEEFIELIMKVLQLGLYDSLILDLAQLPVRINELLGMASELYSIKPVREELYDCYNHRMKQWKYFLETLQIDSVDLMVKEREYYGESRTL